jgi:hypothetical protein
MLSTIKCTKNKKFSFYVKAEVFDEIELVISDGLKVWINNDEINERKITYESRPSSRKKETKLSYLNSVKNAIIVNPEATTLPNAVEYSYEMTETEGGILNFTLKEKLPNTTLVTVLYKGSFIDKLLLPNETRVSTENNNPLMEFLDTLGSVMHQKRKSIQDLENNNKDYQQVIDQNVADIKLLNEWKENLQNQMISKMCVVLNSKKREIQQLREQLGEAPTGSRGRRTAAAAEPEEEKEIEEPAAAKPKATKGRKPAAVKPAAAAAAPKRTARKTNLDKFQSNIKATANKRTTAAAKNKKKTQLSDDEDEEEEEAEFEDDDDEEEDNEMELDLQSDSTNTDDGDLLHSSDESGHENERPKRVRAKRGGGGKTATSKKKNTTTTTSASTSVGGDSGKGFDFERIKRLAEQFDKKDSHNSTTSSTTAGGKNKRTATEANEDSDATVDEDDPPMKKKFLANPKNVKEVDGSQIVGFLSSQGGAGASENNKSYQTTTTGGGNKDDDETNDDASVQVPVAAPPKKTQMENKKSKSRKLLEVSDDD